MKPVQAKLQSAGETAKSRLAKETVPHGTRKSRGRRRNQSHACVARPVSVNIVETTHFSERTHKALLIGLHGPCQSAVNVEYDQAHGSGLTSSATVIGTRRPPRPMIVVPVI